ncbi:MAG: hypothetical protein Q8P59_10730 [Dehalococcoidia bacterium]|nr:hypothetical protein [Dehalococcoidia bacterium]
MITKEELHKLVEDLPQGEMEAARRYLQYLRDLGDPLLRMLMQAPFDDELEDDEERAAIAEARREIAAGQVVSHEDIRREFGL